MQHWEKPGSHLRRLNGFSKLEGQTAAMTGTVAETASRRRTADRTVRICEHGSGRQGGCDGAGIVLPLRFDEDGQIVPAPGRAEEPAYQAASMRRAG